MAAVRSEVLGPRDAVALGRTIEERVAERVLWLATQMVHEANVVRPNPDGLKVGGHQASSASVVAILAALYLRWLRPGDLVSVKPHASPAYHAVMYLLGGLDEGYLPGLRSFGGLQAYPSRTKDPDRIDFSTGSVGLGAVAPLYAALADSYLRAHFPETAGSEPERRFVSIVGDAELDEGSVWESALEGALAGIGNFTMIVDLNRQSLDRVVPGIRVRQLESMFRGAGWQVLEVKYGRRLGALFGSPGGATLQRRIDEMSNEEYQLLLRRDGATIRERVLAGTAATERKALERTLGAVSDADLPMVFADLGGHDIEELCRALDEADADRTRPSVIFAYTIKGWRLPIAGDVMNHSAMLTTEQIESLATDLDVDRASPWAGFTEASDEGRLCLERGRYLDVARQATRSGRETVFAEVNPTIRVPDRMSTQQAFGDSVAALARDETIGSRVVTASPDVAVSTNLGGWVNRVGVFALDTPAIVDDTPRLLQWSTKPAGRHIELGISEMNLFLLLSQFGLTAELFDQPLVPIGTVYDPFICRGLDALIYALYVRARFVIAGTPSGITLAPEGGAHQSAITPSIGIELPGLRMYEPAFGQEVAWLVGEAVRGVLHPQSGFSTYLRLSTRPIDQKLVAPLLDRLGEAGWRQQVIAGGYRLIEASDSDDLPAGSPVVNVVATGAVVPEAAEAVRRLIHEEVSANLIVVSSAERLASELHDLRLRSVRDRSTATLHHLETLFPSHERRAPMVTVTDGASHSLGFLGGAFGAPVVPLGVDAFGQSGRVADLYAEVGIDADHIFEAALLALELDAR